MEIICKELGLYKAGMTKDGGRYEVPELSMKSMKYALLAQPHIKAQRSRLEELIESRGHVMPRHARCWSALLNFIEVVFARSKRLTRAWNNHKQGSSAGGGAAGFDGDG